MERVIYHFERSREATITSRLRSKRQVIVIKSMTKVKKAPEKLELLAAKKKYLLSSANEPCITCKDALVLMDEYAGAKSIEFVIWAEESPYFYSAVEDRWYNVNDKKPAALTTEELYLIFNPAK